jgi:hypothetical protein
VQSADPHPAPKARDLQKGIESRGQLIVSEELLQTPLSVRCQTTPPPAFKVWIPLEMILTNLAVDLALARFLFIGIFLD